MSYRAWFQCINPQCRAEYPLNSIIYRCKTCGSLLEVQHDLQALARREAVVEVELQGVGHHVARAPPRGEGDGEDLAEGVPPQAHLVRRPRQELRKDGAE